MMRVMITEFIMRRIVLCLFVFAVIDDIQGQGEYTRSYSYKNSYMRSNFPHLTLRSRRGSLN